MTTRATSAISATLAMTTPSPERQPRRLIAIGLVLLPVAVLVVQLQLALTTYSDLEARRIGRERGIAQYVAGRYEASGLPESEWIIINARLLMRYPIRAVQWMWPHARVVSANALVQTLLLWAGLFVLFLLTSRFADAGWSLAATLAAALWL